jgi:hypothetical protein
LKIYAFLYLITPALIGAGAYAIISGTVTDRINWKGFFDDKKDTRMIERGYYGK